MPTLRELPKLTALTLTSAIGGGGGTGGGGSTVFGLLLAAGLAVLSACSADQQMEPTSGETPKVVASIPCVGDVATKSIRCGSFQAAPGQEIIGGQGVRVVLRSSNVDYTGTDFTFDVTIQNLSAQTIGFDGTSATGVRVFFPAAPVATSGSGTITVEDDSVGTFTAPGQDYYMYSGSLANQGISASVPWRLSIPGTVTTFTFNVLVAADVFDQGGPLVWTPINGFNQQWFNDVAASSPTDRMAVGNNGFTARWNGSSWVALPGIVSENINSVIAIAPGEYLAATAGGAVLHFKGTVWTEIYRRGDGGGFRAIWAKDLTQIVAVGAAGRTSHLSGGTWSDEDVATAGGNDFIAVSGNAAGTLVSALVGAFTANEVWTSAAGGPLTINPAFPAITGVANAIAYDGSGDALVAYIDYSGPPLGYVQSSTGDTVLIAFQFPMALIPHGSKAVAVGYLDLNDGLYYVEDMDYTSLPATRTIISGDLGGIFDITKMTATDPGTTQFAVTSSNGHLLHWDGAIWADDQGGGTMYAPDIWGSGNTVWLLDGIGNFYEIVGGVATARPGQLGLTHLWGSSSTSFWAINETDVYHSDGTSGWTYEATVPVGSDNRDIWADPTGNAVIALGENGVVFSRVLGTWSLQLTGLNVLAVWGCDEHNAWVVTEEGWILKWTDGGLGVEGIYSEPFRAITGSSCSDIWVSGDNGRTIHWDGITWNDLGDMWTGASIRALAIRGPGEVYAAGLNGQGFLFTDPPALAFLNLPVQGKEIGALWRLDNGQVVVAGNQVLLRGLR